MSLRRSLNAVLMATSTSLKIRVDTIPSVIPRVLQAEENGPVLLCPVHNLVNA